MKCSKCNRKATYKLITHLNGTQHAYAIAEKTDLTYIPYCNKHSITPLAIIIMLNKMENDNCGLCEKIYKDIIK